MVLGACSSDRQMHNHAYRTISDKETAEEANTILVMIAFCPQIDALASRGTNFIFWPSWPMQLCLVAQISRRGLFIEFKFSILPHILKALQQKGLLDGTGHL